MPALIGIVIGIFVVIWFIQTYPAIAITIVLSIAGFFVVRFFIREDKKRREKQAAEEAARLAEERRREEARRAEAQRLAAEQQGYENQLLSACRESLVAFEDIPKHLLTAEELLDTAESEFKEGVFSPFWDSIEKTAAKLGAVDSNIQLIADRSHQYQLASSHYRNMAPPFPVDPASAQRVRAASGTAARLRGIVRTAQRNFQFATIYEQRKTNSILVAGFTSLGEAIDGLGNRIERSIDTLGDKIGDLTQAMADHTERIVDAVEEGNEALLQSIESNNEKLVETVQGVSASVDATRAEIDRAHRSMRTSGVATQKAIAEQLVRQEKANRMLDNIQRRRVPPTLSEY